MRQAAKKHPHSRKEPDPFLEFINKWEKRAIALFAFVSMLLAFGVALKLEAGNALNPLSSHSGTAAEILNGKTDAHTPHACQCGCVRPAPLPSDSLPQSQRIGRE